jgi:hypothetical protein
MVVLRDFFLLYNGLYTQLTAHTPANSEWLMNLYDQEKTLLKHNEDLREKVMTVNNVLQGYNANSKLLVCLCK